MPPKRPYRKREMVVHTPSKLEVLRQTAAERRAAGVPPSVQAAGAAAAADTQAVSAGALGTEAGQTVTPPLLGNLLDPQEPVRHDFDLWDGNNPPGFNAGRQIEVQAEINGAATERENINVTTRRPRDGVFTSATDLPDGAVGTDNAADNTDKISVAGSVSDVTPPPNTHNHPPLNPFTAEWFAQLVETAATAAATAVANSSRAPPPPPAFNPLAPRRLNDRKVPDFWEEKPELWFNIFDAHLFHFNPSEKQCFDALLPLLTPAARASVLPIIRTPGPTPYTRAREVLLFHFGRTPRQLAREFRDCRSLGDRLPTEYLDHLESLIPDIKVLFEVYLLDALPDNARVAALQHSDPRTMARAADAVVRENRSVDADRAAQAVSSLSLLDSDLGACTLPPLAPSPAVAAVGRDARATPQKTALCSNHKRWGKDTYKCLLPASCKMRGVLAQRPPAPAPSAASGNARAGSRQ